MPPKAKFTDAEEKHLTDNCMLRPLKNIAAELGRPYTTCKSHLKSIGVIIPVEVTNHFKRFHTDIGTPPKVRKNYYVPKPLKTKKKKATRLRAKQELPKDAAPVKPEPILPIKKVDYSTKIMVKVDSRTWVYRDK